MESDIYEGLNEQINALTYQLAQAKADNVAMVEALNKWKYFAHFCGKPVDWRTGDSLEELYRQCIQMGEIALSSPHPGADLLRELEQYKASDASKEQYIAEVYSRAREAERELAEYKAALDEVSLKLAREMYPALCEEDQQPVAKCLKAHVLRNVDAKEALSDGTDTV